MSDSVALLRHTVATLAYRAGKALRGAPPEFGEFRAMTGMRSPVEILAHMGDLFDWALALANGRHDWRNSPPRAWDQEVTRFFAALSAFDERLGSAEPLERSAERLFQGPVADALTHVGQIALLRRMAGCPIRGENYFRAEIVAGRTSFDQAAPKMEFD